MNKSDLISSLKCRVKGVFLCDTANRHYQQMFSYMICLCVFSSCVASIAYCHLQYSLADHMLSHINGICITFSSVGKCARRQMQERALAPTEFCFFILTFYSSVEFLHHTIHAQSLLQSLIYRMKYNSRCC